MTSQKLDEEVKTSIILLTQSMRTLPRLNMYTGLGQAGEHFTAGRGKKGLMARPKQGSFTVGFRIPQVTQVKPLSLVNVLIGFVLACWTLGFRIVGLRHPGTKNAPCTTSR